MAEVGTFHQWSTTTPFVGAFPKWVGGLHSERIAAYLLYEQMYKNHPDGFKVVWRSEDKRPLYVPTAKKIVNTFNRYVANKLEVVPDPILGDVPPDDPALVAMRSLFDRERFYSRFSSAKKMGLVRGDMVLMLQGDLLKAEGTRLSIVSVDPAAYFPIYDEDHPDVIVGVHLAEQRIVGDDVLIWRLTFRKETPDGQVGGPGQITVEEALYKSDEWGGPNMKEGKPEEVIMPPTPLDPRITAIPVYHFRFNYEEGQDYGTSILSGFEGVLNGINQSASDEDLALSLDGLGVYSTDAGAPVDENGDEVAWNIGPGRVVELPDGKSFDRVSGVASVEPYQGHLSYLSAEIMSSIGLSDIALGRVDVQVAESGIALTLELAPTIDAAEEMELEITATLKQMLWDLKTWLQVYEGTNTGDMQFLPKYGDKIPLNRKQRFDECMALLQAKVVSGGWVRSELRRLGYVFPDEATMIAQIMEEGQIQSDITGARIGQDLNSGFGAG